MPRRLGRASAVVFALLVVATIAAFAYSQRLKRDPLILDRVTFIGVPRPNPSAPPVRSFTPNGDCRFDRTRIRFRVTRTDRGTVQVVKPGGMLIATLARDVPLKRYRFFTFYWGGWSRLPGNAPAGRYKLRVKLLGQDRVLVPPGVMRLHRAPPRPTPGCAAGGGSAS